TAVRVVAHPGPGCPRTPGRTSERVRGERVLRLEVLVDALGTALAAQARHLPAAERCRGVRDHADVQPQHPALQQLDHPLPASEVLRVQDRKSTRLNSSHVSISYAVFCLKKKTQS